MAVCQPDLIQNPTSLFANTQPVFTIKRIDDHRLIGRRAYNQMVEVVPLTQLCLQYDDFVVRDEFFWLHVWPALTHGMDRWSFK